MSAQHWKRQEPRIAAILSTTRIPNNGAGQPDIQVDVGPSKKSRMPSRSMS